MNTKLPNFGGSNATGNDSKYFQTTKKGAPQRQLASSAAVRDARRDTPG